MSVTYINDVSFGAEDMLAKHIGDMVNIGIANHGDKAAFSCVLPTGHTKTLTFTQVGHYSDAVAAYLREDLKLVPGDVVAVQSPNALAYPVLIYGILKAGLRITNVNPLYTAEETNHQLKDSAAKVWFVLDIFGDRVQESIKGTSVERIYKISITDFYPAFPKLLVGFAMKYIKKVVPAFDGEVSGTIESVIKAGQKHLSMGVNLTSYMEGTKLEDVAIYQYTGGTTGRSKGAELTHGNIVGNVSQNVKAQTLVAEDDDAMALIIPLYHVYALVVGINAAYNGCHIVLVPVPRPLSNLKVVFEKFKITLFPSVNTLYQGLLSESWFVKNPVKSFRLCLSGAAPLQPATADAWEKLTGVKIHEGYGLTESSAVVSSMPRDKPIRPGSCGVPIPGTDIRIVNDEGKDMPRNETGEILIRGPQIMRGYLNRPDANKESLVDGWFKTGDVGKVDEDGYLYIVDRIKDMIIVSGFNVYPTDIEAVLTKHDNIAEAAVVGVDDIKTGERVVAYIVTANDTMTEKDVIAYCREDLTNYKIPKTVVFVDDLPKSPVGKVLRREVRDLAKSQLATK